MTRYLTLEHLLSICAAGGFVVADAGLLDSAAQRPRAACVR